MNHVTLENCILNQTTLAFEKCSNINATIDSKITSVKNPISGVIKAKEIDTLIIRVTAKLDSQFLVDDPAD